MKQRHKTVSIFLWISSVYLMIFRNQENSWTVEWRMKLDSLHLWALLYIKLLAMCQVLSIRSFRRRQSIHIAGSCERSLTRRSSSVWKRGEIPIVMVCLGQSIVALTIYHVIIEIFLKIMISAFLSRFVWLFEVY